jgi:hypothetical protein
MKPAITNGAAITNGQHPKYLHRHIIQRAGSQQRSSSKSQSIQSSDHDNYVPEVVQEVFPFGISQPAAKGGAEQCEQDPDGSEGCHGNGSTKEEQY